MEKLSPIERMIDAACNAAVPLPVHARLSSEEKGLANSVAGSVLRHIDEMYPAMWHGVPKCARTSVRNTIQQEVGLAMIQAKQQTKAL